MRKLWHAIIFTLMIPTNSYASFLMQVAGDTTVVAEAAPVRDEYPDGQIIGVLHKNDVVDVNGAAGDGRGTWVQVKSKTDKNIKGFVAAGQTTFFEDMKSGRLKQPSQ